MQDAPARECGCREWEVRCAHIDGRTLYLVDDSIMGGGLLVPYAVVSFPPHEKRPVEADHIYYMGSDFDKALAAFYEAERQLIERQDG